MDGNYVSDCEAGGVYERFIATERSRESVKVELYKAIYFDFKQKKPIADEFMKLYPLTYQSLQALNAEADTLASKLQNIEASIFNALRPVKSKYYFTLFDTIYFTDSKEGSGLVDQITERFGEFRIVPKVVMSY